MTEKSKKILKKSEKGHTFAAEPNRKNQSRAVTIHQSRLKKSKL
jgi:hypothetical protein